MTRTLLFLLLTPVAWGQWQMQDSHTTSDLRGIHALTNGVAWASGSNGTILRTMDGGNNWAKCTVPEGGEKLDFRGIQGLDADSAIVMSSGKGDLSRLYKTMDGCKTWKLALNNPDKEGFWDALLMLGSNGWLLGDPVGTSFVIFKTDDSGTTWVEQRGSGLRADPSTQGAFAASNSSLSERLGSVVFATGGAEGSFLYRIESSIICLDECSEAEQDRAGRTTEWKRYPVPIGQRLESSGVYSLALKEDDHGEPIALATIVSVGGDYTKSNAGLNSAAVSSNGGETWTLSSTPPHGYRSAVAYDATRQIWITVGPNGTDVSTDDGKNWKPLKPGLNDAPDADQHWNALSLPFVVGPHGRIGLLRPNAVAR